MPDDAIRREREATVLGLLEQMACAVEEAEKLVQDDSRLSEETDVPKMRDAMRKLRALSIEVDHLLHPLPFG